MTREERDAIRSRVEGDWFEDGEAPRVMLRLLDALDNFEAVHDRLAEMNYQLARELNELDPHK